MQRERRLQIVKISKLEFVMSLLTAAFLAFAAGWFLGGNASAKPLRITAERTLDQPETVVLPAPSPEAGGAEAGRVNINSADSETLQTLPGIGEKRAADIIAYREENGPFRIPEDLTKVKGIGEATMEGLLDYISVK